MSRRKMKVFILILPLIILCLWVFHKSSLNSTNNYLSDIISNLDDISFGYNFGILQDTFENLLNVFNIDSTISQIISWYFSYLIIIEMLFVVYDLFTFILSFTKVGDRQ